MCYPFWKHTTFAASKGRANGFVRDDFSSERLARSLANVYFLTALQWAAYWPDKPIQEELRKQISEGGPAAEEAFQQVFGDYTKGIAARGLRCIGHGAHDADVSGPIDKTPSLVRNQRAQFDRCGFIAGIVT